MNLFIGVMANIGDFIREYIFKLNKNWFLKNKSAEVI